METKTEIVHLHSKNHIDLNLSDVERNTVFEWKGQIIGYLKIADDVFFVTFTENAPTMVISGLPRQKQVIFKVANAITIRPLVSLSLEVLAIKADIVDFQGDLKLNYCEIEAKSLQMVGDFVINRGRFIIENDAILDGNSTSVISYAEFVAQSILFLGKNQNQAVYFITDDISLEQDSAAQFINCHLKVTYQLSLDEQASTTLINTFVKTETLYLQGKANLEKTTIECDVLLTSEMTTCHACTIMTDDFWQDFGAKIDNCDITTKFTTLQKQTSLTHCKLLTKRLTYESVGTISDSAIHVFNYVQGSKNSNLTFVHSYLQTEQNYSEGILNLTQGSGYQCTYMQQSAGNILINGSVTTNNELLSTIPTPQEFTKNKSSLFLEGALLKGSTALNYGEIRSKGPIVFSGQVTANNAIIRGDALFYFSTGNHQFKQSHILCEKEIITTSDMVLEESTLFAKSLYFSGQLKAKLSTLQTLEDTNFSKSSVSNFEIASLHAGKKIIYQAGSTLNGTALQTKSDYLTNNGSITIDTLSAEASIITNTGTIRTTQFGFRASLCMLNYGHVESHFIKGQALAFLNYCATMKSTQSTLIQSLLYFNVLSHQSSNGNLNLDSLVHFNALGLTTGFDTTIRTLVDLNYGLRFVNLPNTLGDLFTVSRVLGFSKMALSQLFPFYSNSIAAGTMILPLLKQSFAMCYDLRKTYELVKSSFTIKDASDVLPIVMNLMSTGLSAFQLRKSTIGAVDELQLGFLEKKLIAQAIDLSNLREIATKAIGPSLYTQTLVSHDLGAVSVNMTENSHYSSLNIGLKAGWNITGNYDHLENNGAYLGANVIATGKTLQNSGFIKGCQMEYFSFSESITNSRSASMQLSNAYVKSPKITNHGNIDGQNIQVKANHYVKNTGKIISNYINIQALAVADFGSIHGTKNKTIQAPLYFSLLGSPTSEGSLNIDSIVHLSLGGMERAYDLNIRSIFDLNFGIRLPFLPTSLDQVSWSRTGNFMRLGLSQLLPEYNSAINLAYTALPFAMQSTESAYDFLKSDTPYGALPYKLYDYANTSWSNYKNGLTVNELSDVFPAVMQVATTALNTGKTLHDINAIYKNNTIPQVNDQPMDARRFGRTVFDTAVATFGCSLDEKKICGYTLFALFPNLTESAVYETNYGVKMGWNHTGYYYHKLKNYGIFGGAKISATGQTIENSGIIYGWQKAVFQLSDKLIGKAGATFNLGSTYVQSKEMDNGGEFTVTDGLLDVKDQVINQKNARLGGKSIKINSKHLGNDALINPDKLSVNVNTITNNDTIKTKSFEFRARHYVLNRHEIESDTLTGQTLAFIDTGTVHTKRATKLQSLLVVNARGYITSYGRQDIDSLAHLNLAGFECAYENNIRTLCNRNYGLRTTYLRSIDGQFSRERTINFLSMGLSQLLPDYSNIISLSTTALPLLQEFSKAGLSLSDVPGVIKSAFDELKHDLTLKDSSDLFPAVMNLMSKGLSLKNLTNTVTGAWNEINGSIPVPGEVKIPKENPSTNDLFDYASGRLDMFATTLKNEISTVFETLTPSSQDALKFCGTVGSLAVKAYGPSINVQTVFNHNVGITLGPNLTETAFYELNQGFKVGWTVGGYYGEGENQGILAGGQVSFQGTSYKNRGLFANFQKASLYFANKLSNEQEGTMNLSNAYAYAQESIVFEKEGSLKTHDCYFDGGEQLLHHSENHEQSGFLVFKAKDVQTSLSSNLYSKASQDNAFFVDADTGDFKGTMRLDRGDFKVKNLNGATDLIWQQGQSSEQHFAKFLSVTTEQSFDIGTLKLRPCDMSINGTYVTIVKDYNFEHSLQLTGTKGVLFNGDLSAKGVILGSSEGSIIVNGKTVTGQTFVYGKAAQDIIMATIPIRIKGEYGSETHYSQASILGGAGEEHTGNIGVFLQANNKLILDAPNVLAQGKVIASGDKGVEFDAKTSLFISEQSAHAKRVLGIKHGETTKETSQTKTFVSTLGSVNDKVLVLSSEGAVTGVPGNFIAAQGTDIVAYEEVELKSLITTESTKKTETGLFGLNSKTSKEMHDTVRLVEFVSNGGETRLHSNTQDVDMTNLRFSGIGHLYPEAPNGSVFYEATKLNHSLKIREMRWLLSTPIDKLLKTLKDKPLKSLLEENKALFKANTPAELLANLSNLTVHGFTLANQFKEGNYSKQVLQTLGVTPKIDLTMTQTKTSTKFQTGTGAGIFLEKGSVNFLAKEEVSLAGTPVVADALTVETKTLNMKGQCFESEQHIDTKSASLGVNIASGNVDASVSLSAQHKKEKKYKNLEVKVKHIKINAQEAVLDAANVNCESSDINLDKLTLISRQEESEQSSQSIGASTTGVVHIHASKAKSTQVNQTAGIHVRGDIKEKDIQVRQAILLGGTVTSEGHNAFVPEKLITQPVNDFSHSKSTALSGGLKDISLAYKTSDYKARNNPTIFGEKSVSDTFKTTNQDLSTTEPSKQILYDKSQNIKQSIPIEKVITSVQKGMQFFKPAKPSESPVLEKQAVANPIEDEILSVSVNNLNTHPYPPQDEAKSITEYSFTLTPESNETNKPISAFNPVLSTQRLGIKQGRYGYQLSNKGNGQYTTLNKEFQNSAAKNHFITRIDTTLLEVGNLSEEGLYRARYDNLSNQLLFDINWGKDYVCNIDTGACDLGMLGSLSYTLDASSAVALARTQLMVNSTSTVLTIGGELGIIGPSAGLTYSTPDFKFMGLTMQLDAELSGGLGLKANAALGVETDLHKMKASGLARIGLFAGLGGQIRLKPSIALNPQYFEEHHKAFRVIVEEDTYAISLVDKLQSGKILTDIDHMYIESALDDVGTKTQISNSFYK